MRRPLPDTERTNCGADHAASALCVTAPRATAPVAAVASATSQASSRRTADPGRVVLVIVGDIGLVIRSP